jgi:hypothetical protein
VKYLSLDCFAFDVRINLHLHCKKTIEVSFLGIENCVSWWIQKLRNERRFQEIRIPTFRDQAVASRQNRSIIQFLNLKIIMTENRQ